MEPPEEQPESTGNDSTGIRRQDWQKGILALIDQAFVSLNSFVTFVLVAQFCSSRSDVNLYVLAWSIFNILRVIQERGLAAPYFVFAHDKQRNSSTFLGSSLVHQFGFSIIAAILFAFLAAFFSWWQSPQGMVACSLMLILAGPCVLTRDHLRAISCAHFRYGHAVMLSATAMLLQIVLILIAYFLNQLNVVVVFAAMGIGSLIPSVFWLWIRPQNFQFDRRRIVPDWQATSNFSKWLVAARFFPTAATGILPWIVVWAIDENAAGTLGSCITLANISNMFVVGANYYFLPKAVQALNHHGTSAMMKILLQTGIVFGVVLSALCLFYWFLGDQLLTVAFGTSFAGNSQLVAAFGLSYLIVSFSTIAGNGMTAIGRPEGLFWGELCYGIVATISTIVLVQTNGLIGAAYAICLASATATMVEGYYLWKLIDEPATANRLQKSAQR